MSAWGSGSWGGSGGAWGGVPAGFDLVAVWATSAQGLRLRFSTGPVMGGVVDGAPLGLVMVGAFTLVSELARGVTTPPLAPTVLGASRFSETEVDLILDSPLAGAGVRYLLTVSSEVKSEGGQPIGIRTGRFWGLTTRATSPTAIKSDGSPGLVDVAATLGGGFGYTAEGDLALSTGLDTLRLRVGRRCLTRRNGFAWLDSFGLLPGQSSLITRSSVSSLEETAREQVGQEPDLIDADARIQHMVGRGLMFVSVNGRLRQGGDFSTSVPLEV